MTSIFNQFSGKGLRKSLRGNMSKAEVMLWSCLKGKQMDGVKFRRQHSIGPYVVDFYCPSRKLAIEIDGDSHFQKGAQESDRERQKYIESFGVKFLRFTNGDIYHNIDGVIGGVWEEISKKKEKTKNPSLT
ncbi:MAG TPA: endonuclease domain-containing protein [Candidatus Peregrinibacteria bacterium]|nr:endonuclease domain-containing protein [Candidatus Peregrinibacteria bacterium]